ncbi:MAG TPA: hypothetical protein VGF69_09470 [Thermoanaerobaculia bacterium]
MKAEKRAQRKTGEGDDNLDGVDMDAMVSETPLEEQEKVVE